MEIDPARPRWQEARRLLSGIACLPAHRGVFGRALLDLEQLGLSPRPVERALFHFWAKDRTHAAAQARANLGIRFSPARRRARRDLVSAVNAALRQYESFYNNGAPPAAPIYLLLRELRDLLKLSLAAASARGRALPDLFFADPIWDKRLRRPQRGRRRKPHRTVAEDQLRKAKVPARLIPVLLRSVAAPPASK